MRLRSSAGSCLVVVLLVTIALLALILAGRHITRAVTEFWGAYIERKEARGEAAVEVDNEVKYKSEKTEGKSAKVDVLGRSGASILCLPGRDSMGIVEPVCLVSLKRGIGYV